MVERGRRAARGRMPTKSKAIFIGSAACTRSLPKCVCMTACLASLNRTQRKEIFSGALNPESRRIVRAWLEPGAQAPATEERVQFERQGYFVTDCIDSTPQRLVFNRIARLKDRWSKA